MGRLSKAHWDNVLYVAARPGQSLWLSMELLPRYRNVSIFKMAIIRHQGFVKIRNLNIWWD